GRTTSVSGTRPRIAVREKTHADGTGHICCQSKKVSYPDLWTLFFSPSNTIACRETLLSVAASDATKQEVSAAEQRPVTRRVFGWTQGAPELLPFHSKKGPAAPPAPFRRQ
uniref:Uncharacterized protein n=1 Tax=Zea mays TaxID=4577 RepID=A0A804UMY0_MAIZE